jgi:hypothetical protein
MTAACYARRIRECAARPLPEFRHKPAANRPGGAVSGAAASGLMTAKLPTTRPAMKVESSPHDPNVELRSFEPLRISLALGALLLGLLTGLY